VILNGEENASEVGHCRKRGKFDAGNAVVENSIRVIIVIILKYPKDKWDNN
jgi:hypothetical protein